MQVTQNECYEVHVLPLPQRGVECRSTSSRYSLNVQPFDGATADQRSLKAKIIQINKCAISGIRTKVK